VKKLQTEYPGSFKGEGGTTDSPNRALALATSNNLHASVSVNTVALSSIIEGAGTVWVGSTSERTEGRLHAKTASRVSDMEIQVFLFIFSNSLFQYMDQGRDSRLPVKIEKT
jgi:hypothetical protein